MISRKQAWSIHRFDTAEEEAMVAVAQRRIVGLARWADWDGMTIRALLTSAYLQGVKDAADAVIGKGWEPPHGAEQPDSGEK